MEDARLLPAREHARLDLGGRVTGAILEGLQAIRGHASKSASPGKEALGGPTVGFQGLISAISYIHYMQSPPRIVREARVRAGLTQSELARRLGLTQAAVARLERPGANPTVATLDRVLRETGRRLELSAPEAKSSIDDTLIAANLRLSPKERLAAFSSGHRGVNRLREAAARSRGEAA
jgi:transcriptional regulator with XRE-family HTH domain